MFKDYTLKTTLGRALVALVGGVLVGGVIGSFFLSMMVTNAGHQAEYFALSRWVQNIPASLRAAGFVIMIIGVPIWLVIHIGGFRTWLTMAIVGFAIPSSFLIYLINTNRRLNRIWHDPEAWGKHFGETATGIMAFPLTGVAVALTIWFIAYRRPAEHV